MSINKALLPKKVVESPEGCWLWQGKKDRNGYSLLTREGKLRVGHRWVWEKMNGPIPDDLEIDHVCRIRNCLNPAHMRLVTRRENVRAYRDLQKMCKNNHPLDRTRLDRGYVVRYCSTCQRGHEKRNREAKKSRE